MRCTASKKILCFVGLYLLSKPSIQGDDKLKPFMKAITLSSLFATLRFKGHSPYFFMYYKKEVMI